MKNIDIDADDPEMILTPETPTTPPTTLPIVLDKLPKSPTQWEKMLQRLSIVLL